MSKKKQIRRNKITNVDLVVIETINHIITEFSKLAQKEYKARHDWAKKTIHWKLCKKLKFDHVNKWYMHDPQSVLEN